ncbi:MAG: methylenetetrahydrofolate reductase [NAD(P)H] [Thermohalobaculum sp.]|nr:methylenetetrahydrofolate reductase [NAD(P)H] [Thermohalobaculum sp.]
MTKTGTSPRISFEFFPPKTPRAAVQLWESVERLAPLAPTFVSVTYGAGGTTRDRTLAAILAIRERARLEVAGHLTCVGATKDEVLKVARGYAKLGCRRIVALRGDPPAGAGSFQPHPKGFAGSVELIAALAGMGQFEIFVGAYPEKHPEAADTRADIEHLKRKIDAGAAGAITQFFFENATFHRFRDACAAAGITAPILPGILPIDDFEKTAAFAARCGTAVPDWMHRAYANADTQADHDLLSVAIAAEQCDDLLSNGVPHLHLYTLNKPELPWQVCRALGVEPHPMRMAASCG